MWPIWREPDEFLETALDVFGCRHCRVIIHGIDGFSTGKKCDQMCVVAREEERTGSCEKKGNREEGGFEKKWILANCCPFTSRHVHNILS